MRDINRILKDLDGEKNILELYLRTGRFADLQKELLRKWVPLQKSLIALNKEARRKCLVS